MVKIGPPDVGDVILIRQAGDYPVVVGRIRDEQPLADDGVYMIYDRDGDARLCGRDGDDWVQVMDSQLTDEQSEAVAQVLWGDGPAGP